MAKKNTSMLGVIFDQLDDGTPIIDSDSSTYYIPFDKPNEYFDSYENKVKFIKECEAQVRRHPFYKVYISYLNNVVGMKTCQVLPNIEADPKGKVTTEMHHGPMFTLFDTCEIILNHLIVNNDPNITTFKVSKICIEEHRLNHVRVMFLTKTIHQAVHNDDIMLNYNMGFGDTAEFIRIYHDGLDRSMIKRINAYIEWSKKNDSFDNDVLAVSEHMKKYENDFDEFEDTYNGLID